MVGRRSKRGNGEKRRRREFFLKRGGLARGKAFGSAKKKKRGKKARNELTLPGQRVERVKLLFELVRREVDEVIALDCEREEKVGGREVSA